jgi:hypothetical protein
VLTGGVRQGSDARPFTRWASRSAALTNLKLARDDGAVRNGFAAGPAPAGNLAFPRREAHPVAEPNPPDSEDSEPPLLEIVTLADLARIDNTTHTPTCEQE